jgi:hypothetical protein
MRYLWLILSFFVVGWLVGEGTTWLSEREPSKPAFVGQRYFMSAPPDSAMVARVTGTAGTTYIDENKAVYDDSTGAPKSITRIVERLPGADSVVSSSSVVVSSSSVALVRSLKKLNPGEVRLLSSSAAKPMESWVRQFAQALDRMDDEGRYQTVRVARGEYEMMQVLVRVYGSKARTLPGALVQYGILAKNPQVKSLTEGVELRLPKF